MPESRANRGPTEVPRSPELETRHHMRTSNERLDRAVGTPYRDRWPGEPGTEATRRRRRQTKPSKQHQKGLILHSKQRGTAEPPLRMQKQPQLPYSITAPCDYQGCGQIRICICICICKYTKTDICICICI